MTQEAFKKIMNKYLQYHSDLDKIEDLFGGISMDAPLFSGIEDIIWGLLFQCFNEKQIGWIEYYLYENPEKCYYADNKKVPLENLDDLWNLISEYNDKISSL